MGQNSQKNWGINGLGGEGNTDLITKLSWTRIDKLIWDSLSEILTGKERHYEGRYTELGTKESAAPGILDKLSLDDSNHSYMSNAPILGTEMARGTMTYHAMPFHRYWFYRTRQALRNAIERRKMTFSDVYADYQSNSDKMSLDEYVVSQVLTGDGFGNGTPIGDEIAKLEKYFTNKLITPCSMASVGFAHSLAKNFLLCNGRTIKFHNFPNISLTNEAIYNTGELIGSIANFDANNKVFEHRTPEDGTAAYAMLMSSSGQDGKIKLPNLFALFEKSPRFIRG